MLGLRHGKIGNARVVEDAHSAQQIKIPVLVVSNDRDVKEKSIHSAFIKISCKQTCTSYPMNSIDYRRTTQMKEDYNDIGFQVLELGPGVYVVTLRTADRVHPVRMFGVIQ